MKTISEQLLTIAALRDGWHNGEGVTISGMTLMDASRRARDLVAEGYGTPFLYPRVDGGISIEWDERGGGQIIVEPIAPILTREQCAEIIAELSGDE